MTLTLLWAATHRSLLTIGIPERLQWTSRALDDRLRQIAESLEADVIALQEVDDAFVDKVFDPDTYHLELSGRDSALKTGLAIRRGIQYARQADVTALDVGGPPVRDPHRAARRPPPHRCVEHPPPGRLLQPYRRCKQ